MFLLKRLYLIQLDTKYDMQQTKNTENSATLNYRIKNLIRYVLGNPYFSKLKHTVFPAKLLPKNIISAKK